MLTKLDIGEKKSVKKEDKFLRAIKSNLPINIRTKQIKINNELNIDSIKNKLETFADKHFKSAIKEFENEIQYLKNRSPHELIKLEKISSELNQYYNQLVNHKIFDSELLLNLKKKTKESLSKI